MNLRERAKRNWTVLTGKQKLIVGGILAVFLIFLIYGWGDALKTRLEVRQYEKAANKAKKEANEALKKAAEIAGEIKQREAELKELEVQKGDKQTEVNKAAEESDNALDAVNRARSNPRTDNPGADQLCRELAELGYPCG